MVVPLRKAASLAAVLALGACASSRPDVFPPWSPPADVRAAPGSVDVSDEPSASPTEGWTQTGVASWYGDPFHGRATASGEVYDMDQLTAAHQTLPFGTLVRVDNLDNGRSVELRVTDRGPFAKDRIIDLSRAGARALDMIGPGTARVLLTILRAGGDPVSVRGGCVVVQVASYRDEAAATVRARQVGALGFRSDVEASDGWYRVIAGPFMSAVAAEDAVETLEGFLRRCG